MDWLLWSAVAALMACTLIVVVRTRPKVGPTGGSPDGGEASGPLSTYLDKIDELSGKPYDSFFVTALDQTQKHLVQVSAKRQADGTWVYQFDIPVLKWSRGFIPLIKHEASTLELKPILNKTDDGFETLDIYFEDREDHADFTRWVVREVYRHEGRRTYDVTWG